jgi:hypothetical protein
MREFTMKVEEQRTALVYEQLDNPYGLVEIADWDSPRRRSRPSRGPAHRVSMPRSLISRRGDTPVTRPRGAIASFHA